MIRYEHPRSWIQYDGGAVLSALVEAKAAVLSLTSMPYQRSWVEALQILQLKREVAGTSKIEGAEFVGQELETALRPDVTPEELRTRSQRQAHAAIETYRWIEKLPKDRPIDGALIREVHRRIVTGCDDDHCEPGALRGRDHNVTFGIPPHRGCDGGDPCRRAFDDLTRAVQQEYRGHDPLIQALALHYHFAAMHPFLDGNGRTGRALEALVLQRAGLTDRAFIAMSNYYYDEKDAYLSALSAVRAQEHDLTPFLIFGLRGIKLQCERLFAEIRKHVERAIFRNAVYELSRLPRTPKKRFIEERQIRVLNHLLLHDKLGWNQLRDAVLIHYFRLQHADKALKRDLAYLIRLGAIEVRKGGEYAIRLEWPREMEGPHSLS